MKYNYFSSIILCSMFLAIFIVKGLGTNQNSSKQVFLDGTSRTVSDSNHKHLDSNCVFCKIISGIEPAKIVAENDDVLVFESIAPQYPCHWLIIPKKHIPNLKSAADVTDQAILGKLLVAAGQLGKQLQAPQAFKLAVNEGSSAGQTVFHIHVHFYSQNKLAVAKPKI